VGVILTNLAVPLKRVPSSFALLGKIYGIYDSGGSFFKQDQLNFYFLWQNDTGGDAVVNVSSDVMLNGSCEALAKSTFFIPSPFWGQGTIGTAKMSLGLELSLLEWWNQPPSKPVRQPGQDEDVILVSATGGWAPPIATFS
jgi:hypothetical protein